MVVMTRTKELDFELDDEEAVAFHSYDTYYGTSTMDSGQNQG
jgi:hypothetical protein